MNEKTALELKTISSTAYKKKRPLRPTAGAERGQALICTVLLSTVFVLLVVLLLNLTLLVQNRVKTQNGVDAASLSAAVSYSRGLNIIAASNRLLVAAAVFDALTLAVAKKDPMTRNAVIKAQDAFLKAYPAIMTAQAYLIAKRNDLRASPYPLPPSPVVVWNVGGGNSGLSPSLNVRRRTLWEIFCAVFGKHIDETSSPYSYKDKDGNTHYFSPDEVEQVGEYSSGRPRYRVRPEHTDRRHQGKFVRRTTTVKKGTDPRSIIKNLGKDVLSKIEADLVDAEPGIHNVLVYANRYSYFRNVAGEPKRLQHAVSQAGAAGGSLAFWKADNACYDAQLEPVNVSGLRGAGGLGNLVKAIDEYVLLH